ncbi:MAG TPA: glutaminase A [Coxiellaceae bacterium]|nr:glutaminase A [Coxiellaceae bacterium]
MTKNQDHNHIQTVLDNAVRLARLNNEGQIATYIPELASTPQDITSIAVTLTDGTQFFAGDEENRLYTLQSVAKLVVLIGLLEELGPEKVFSWVGADPSGNDFASLARLDQISVKPSNPMLNAGAIALCGHIPGNSAEQMEWLEKWCEKLFDQKIGIDKEVFVSECATGNKNRSMGFLLKHNKVIEGDIEAILTNYFYLCSFATTARQATYLPLLLANGGLNLRGERILSLATVRTVVSIMMTCGLYNESGEHLVRTGMPAKSGVSGYIVAAVPHCAGIATLGPRINARGNSIRGEIMLEYLARELDWHLAI